MITQEIVRTRMEKMARGVQAAVCEALERVDAVGFRDDSWSRADGSFGSSRVMQDGDVFEKAGVNTSTVTGLLSREAARTARIGDDAFAGEQAPFFVTSISLVIHPRNPFVPAAHAHYRYFELGDGAAPAGWWFGGSADLTPSYLFEEDVIHFHRVHKDACDRYDPACYPRFKQACDTYFYLPHREEHRGVGGIFFGNLNEGDRETLFALTACCAQAFLPAYLPIVQKRKALPFTEEQKRWQRLRRGRYVEFNLVCDRGTAFGLKTSGRTESILMSLPPVAGWEYDAHPVPGSEEARLLDVLRKPRQWA